MDDVMVTGRMTARKKAAGNAVLKDAGLNASQAINLLYSKLIQDKSVSFLDPAADDVEARWKMAAAFVDSLSVPGDPRFAAMTDAQVKEERLRSRGLM